MRLISPLTAVWPGQTGTPLSLLNSGFTPGLVKVSVAVASSRENLNLHLRWFSAKQIKSTAPFFGGFCF